MKYRTGEWAKVKADFQECFGISITPFFDGVLTLAFKKIMIDFVKFDDWLKSTHPNEWENDSMNSIIERNYGKKALKLINEIML
jgi:hypothetical protein